MGVGVSLCCSLSLSIGKSVSPKLPRPLHTTSCPCLPTLLHLCLSPMFSLITHDYDTQWHNHQGIMRIPTTSAALKLKLKQLHTQSCMYILTYSVILQVEIIGIKKNISACFSTYYNTFPAKAFGGNFFLSSLRRMSTFFR